MSWGYVMRFVVAVIVGLGPFGAVGASMPPQEDQASLQASFLQWAFDAGYPPMMFITCAFDQPDLPTIVTCYGVAISEPPMVLAVQRVVGLGNDFETTWTPIQSVAAPSPLDANQPLATVLPETTPGPAGQDSADAAVLAVGEQWNADKQPLIDLINDASYSVESVDLIAWDGSSATLSIAITSGYNGTEYHDEIAWEIVTPLARQHWAAGTPFRGVSGLLPSLTLTVDSSTYHSTYELMVAVADVSITSAHWLASARV